jgi:hypothetical protein
MKFSAIIFSLFCFLSFSSSWAKDWAYKDFDGTWKVFDSKDFPKPKEAPQHLKSGNITFSVTYLDPAGAGFNDATFGAARKATVLAVLQYIDSIILDSGALDVTFTASTNLPMSGTLASAGALYGTIPPGFDPGTAFDHITTGVDPDNSVPDVIATVNYGRTWNSETDDPGLGEFDLFSVLLHEMTHGLGITSLTTSTGTSAISGGNPGVFSTFDDFLKTGNNKDLWMTGGSFQGIASDLTGGDGGVFFTGPNASSAYGSNPPIYAPGVFATGSSIAHWSLSIVGGAVMVPSIGPGIKRRTYSPTDHATLNDLGYQTVPVFPPSSVEAWDLLP